MIANNRKINDLRNDIAYKMERESYISDMFSGNVEGGFIRGEEMIDEFINVGKCPEVKEMIEHLTKEEIMDNAYLRDITIPKATINNISIGRKRAIPANTVTLYKEKNRDLDTFESIDSYFICDRPLRFPAIVEGETKSCWMTVEPNEIESFKEFIDEAEGNVCICGCGLGYVAYMLSLKESVKSVTIVELNHDIVEMFESYILPQFKNKDKIRIVTSDALEYLQNTDLSYFDYVNVDIWRDTLDMLPLYLPCLVIENAYPNVKFSYWLEPTLKDLLRKCLLEQFSGFENKRSTLFEFANVIAKDILDNTDILTKEDLKKLIRLDDMREVLRMWFLTHPQLSAEYRIDSEKKMEEMLSFISAVMGSKHPKNQDSKMLTRLGNNKLF
ncbi:MAG: hypothetical protein K2I70_03165 [Bacilli bacterium]|nr:hypothetical protein [Bacilli bacterium]